ncbi:MAG: D-alanyl-D-alanine carboxypeptidase/D-alanyl-D-alanine-endopeptidase [Bacteroidota bacterium]|nr:D-alanyl-D-alanine carboxypeptidase/D-alanyl-D-alanine-endopeptidase [Bacteroidota bacterium]MDP4232298.1 D-alanyl-D-alanine carboxypeptidase/D-alanyl-D-alanine-endopeptidase [Bacteroidota bacterium]MDP4241437.1 D-alanyl-D-alanine carboxypeptidase/D-alanyl-D-alanine-endopeptidase [Bacteroidota bacterium]MDP4286739.1 D-alanyl-D-alanine carboxypeptidase/D-alanyl-D-alanine-endopeptidase [Bacteroidota bacterium]
MVLLVFVVLSCGARKTAGTGEKPSEVATPFVDTSAYPMHVAFKGTSADTAKALNNLRAQLSDIIGGREFRGATTGLKIVFFEPNDAVHAVFAVNPAVSILPASVEKLFTSSSTIWALGSKYVFTTKLDLAPGASVQGSRIAGNIYLRPSGDPTLRSSDLDELASQLREKGITTIQGDIISDLDGENPLSQQAKEYMALHGGSQISVHDSIVGDNGLIASVDSSGADSTTDEDEDEGEAGALSLFPNFSLDRNIVNVTVLGGASKGDRANVRVYPPISTVVVNNHSTSSAPASSHVRKVGRGRHRRTIRTFARGAMTLRVSSSGEAFDPLQTISISGQIPARSQRTYTFAVRNVPLAMAAVMKWRLAQNGITVTGKPRVERAASEEGQTLVMKQKNLIDLLTQMNKRSDNYLAESMFRKLSTIASVAASAPDQRARKLMRSWLQVCNVDGTQCTFIDGSGLSKANRTTPNTVISLLAAIKQQGMFELFTHTLSVAGYDGTLRHRMIGTPAQYNAHGKTGTLNGVTALAGYVTTGDGQLAAYFITMQHYRGGPWAYKRDQDKIVEALAGFKYSDYQTAQE